MDSMNLGETTFSLSDYRSCFGRGYKFLLGNRCWKKTIDENSILFRWTETTQYVNGFNNSIENIENIPLSDDTSAKFIRKLIENSGMKNIYVINNKKVIVKKSKKGTRLHRLARFKDEYFKLIDNANIGIKLSRHNRRKGCRAFVGKTKRDYLKGSNI
jgi:hypothetical protein